MKPKILIVGTVPYNKKSTSRAFESYFSAWNRDDLAQIFSNTKKPAKGHCKTLYQITDQRMLKRRFNSKIDTGVIFEYEALPEEWSDNSLEVSSSLFSKLYRIGSKKTPFTHLLRRFVWKKKYWCTQKLNSWLDEFKPDCVFLSFSDDFFIPQIALYVAERYDIPIVSSVGDDYYFNTKFSLSPFYYLYKLSYRRLIRRVFAHKGSAIYIGDKIRDKYNSEFKLDGETVYLASHMKSREFSPINKKKPVITYCGNIRCGRNESLDEIGKALGEINSNYILDVYSNENDSAYYKIFDSNPNVNYRGSVPYDEVQNKILNSDIVVIAEGFKKKDILITKYSLSTKVADSLASGASIITYGSGECGAVEYMREINCGLVCSERKKLAEGIKKLMDDTELQYQSYLNAREITKKHHNLQSSAKVFETVVSRALKK